MTDHITTDRLVLRPYQASDAEAVARQIGDFDVSKWLTQVPYPYSTSDALAFFDKVADMPFVRAVTRADQCIGCVSIMNADLGYWYGMDHWGQGYATEAATALVGTYFARQTDPIGSGYLDGNTASRNVLEKLGFTPSGMKQSDCLSRQEKVVNHRMVLCRETWEARA